ncbi:hypothetical protein ZIOFF_073110 [Zingiber officinale]|uniref:Hydrophobic seed protein domain-containing protein n=1 Tax=Zingiber officinale TaxID=94328 RepID=A0A8J5C6Y0_ZINOF|nr:hypothetical protein ZIOFF_073110 [Zingiber officinale]
MRKPASVGALLVLINLATLLLPSLACPYCPTPTSHPPPPPATTPCPPPPPKSTPAPPPPKKNPSPPPPPHKKPTSPPPPKATPSPPLPSISPPPPPKATPSPPHPSVSPSPPPPKATPSPPLPSISPPPPPKATLSPPPPSAVPCPPPPPLTSSCPIDTLKLDACVDLIGGLVHVIIGGNVRSECCPVLEGVADLDAALCLCTTIKAKALGITLLLPIALEVLADCGKHVPSDYQLLLYVASVTLPSAFAHDHSSSVHPRGVYGTGLVLKAATLLGIEHFLVLVTTSPKSSANSASVVPSVAAGKEEVRKYV